MTDDEMKEAWSSGHHLSSLRPGHCRQRCNRLLAVASHPDSAPSAKDANSRRSKACIRSLDLLAIARANVEAHLGDCADPDDPESLWVNAYILAFDKLVDLGMGRNQARLCATEILREYGWPKEEEVE